MKLKDKIINEFYMQDEEAQKMVDLFKRWALEMIGEDEELPMPSMSNPQYPYTRGINATKQEIRQRILDTIGGE